MAQTQYGRFAKKRGRLAGEPPVRRRRPRMTVLAGPNGAGKSTVYLLRIKPRLPKDEFINADLIQKAQLQDQSEQGAYQAAALAETRRRELMAKRRNFVTESTFSHPSKVQLIADAKAAGYEVWVVHVQVQTAELSVERVKCRVEEGGHPVPENKIRERFERNQSLIREAALLADRASVFDNSGLNTPPRHLFDLVQGRCVAMSPDLPEWAATLYAPELAEARRR